MQEGANSPGSMLGEAVAWTSRSRQEDSTAGESAASSGPSRQQRSSLLASKAFGIWTILERNSSKKY